MDAHMEAEREMIRGIMMLLLLPNDEKWQTHLGYFKMHATIFVIKCIVHGFSADAVTDAIRHRHIATIVWTAVVVATSVRPVSDSAARNLWHSNEIGKSENCIIIKSNQHEIKCLKWKFYRESSERSPHEMCMVRAPPRVWVREVDRKRNIIYSVRFCHYWLTNLIFMLKTERDDASFQQSTAVCTHWKESTSSTLQRRHLSSASLKKQSRAECTRKWRKQHTKMYFPTTTET